MSEEVARLRSVAHAVADLHNTKDPRSLTELIRVLGREFKALQKIAPEFIR